MSEEKIRIIPIEDPAFYPAMDQLWRDAGLSDDLLRHLAYLDQRTVSSLLLAAAIRKAEKYEPPKGGAF